MAGNLPFDEPNLPTLFKKIARAEYPTPPWFTPDMTSLLKSMLNPNAQKRYGCSQSCAVTIQAAMCKTMRQVALSIMPESTILNLFVCHVAVGNVVFAPFNCLMVSAGVKGC